jgi:hypothetical protein
MKRCKGLQEYVTLNTLNVEKLSLETLAESILDHQKK